VWTGEFHDSLAPLRKLIKQISKPQSGFVYHYVFAMLIGLTIFITITGLWNFISFWIDN